MQARVPWFCRIRIGMSAALVGCLAVPLNVHDAPAQSAPVSRGAVTGRVVDAATGRPLDGASVILEPDPDGVLPPARDGGAFHNATRTVETDMEGRYRLAGLVAGRYRVHVRRPGYRSTTVGIELRGASESRVSVGLELDPIELEPVEVTAGAVVTPGSAYGRTAASPDAEALHRIAAERLRQRLHLPSDVRTLTHADVIEGITLGETDLFRAIQRLPGVAAPDEFGAELWTRGAAWDHTRVYFDGLPLSNPVHAAGLFSGFSTDAIGAAFLHPGVQPVALGAGAGATLDLRSRRGGRSGADGEGGIHGLGEISLASARVAVDGASAAGRRSWMVSARRTYLDWITGLIERLADADDIRVPYDFSDLVLRYDQDIGGRSALEVSALVAVDRVTGDIPDVLHRTDAAWGSGVVRATLAAPLGPFSSRHTIGFSGFRSGIREREPDSELDSLYAAPDFPASDSHAAHLTLRGELAPAGTSPVAPSPWSLGYEFVHERMSYSGLPPDPYLPPYDRNLRDSTHVVWSRLSYAAFWGERRWEPLSNMTVATGLRLEAGSRVRNGGGLRLAPRISARYTVTPSVFATAGIGRSFQYSQAIAPAGLSIQPGFETELFRVLAGKDAPALRADVATLGAEAWLGTAWIASANAYVRRSTGLATPDPEPGVTLGRPLFVTGEGRAWGVELSARRLAGPVTLSAAYSFGISEILVGGRRFPAPTERRHAVDATAMARLGAGWRIGAAYAYASGAPYTRAGRGSYACSEATGCDWLEEPWVGEPAAQRTSPYRSLDLLLDWRHAFQGWSLGAFLQMRNALGDSNAGRFMNSSSASCHAGADPYCDRGSDEFAPGMPRLPLLGFRVTF